MKASEILKKVLVELSKREVRFAQATLDNGTVIEAENFEVGAEVFIVTEDERIPLPVGEYTLEDGEVLVVNEEGLIGEIASAATEAEEDEAEEVAVEAEEETIEVEAPAEVAPAVEEIVEAVVEVIAPMVEEMKKQMEEIKEEMGKYKKNMSSAKPIKHSPATKKEPQAMKLSSRKEMTTADRILARLAKP